MVTAKKRPSEEERLIIIEELIELIELQIRLREGGILFKIAHFLGLPGTRIEQVQGRIRTRNLLRKRLEREDLSTLREQVEFTKARLSGRKFDYVGERTQFQEKLLRLEETLKDVASELGEKPQ